MKWIKVEKIALNLDHVCHFSIRPNSSGGYALIASMNTPQDATIERVKLMFSQKEADCEAVLNGIFAGDYDVLPKKVSHQDERAAMRKTLLKHYRWEEIRKEVEAEMLKA